MNQKREGGLKGRRVGGAAVIDRGLFEGRIRPSWQEQLEQRWNCSVFMTSIPSGLVRSDRDRAQQHESEVSTPPTHCQRGPTWEWLYPSSPSHSTSLARNSVVCIWPRVCRFLLFSFFFLSPPLPSPFPSIVPPEVFMGRPTGCSAHQEIKVSSSSQCAVAHCDLFNSNRVNITDACKAGITVAELDVLRRDTGSVFFMLWLTYKSWSPFFFFFFPKW